MPPPLDAEKLLAEMGAVWRFAVHLCEVRHAELLVQETFVRAFRDSRPLGEVGVAARLRLFRILHEVAREHDERQEKDDPPGPPPESGSAAFAPALQRPDNEMHVDAALQTAICGLPLPERAVFLLSVVERLRYDDIATIVGASSAQVRRRMNAARLHVAARLKADKPASPATPEESHGLEGERNSGES